MINIMEINTTEIIMGLIGLASSIVTGGATFFFTKRKYKAEVDSTEIDNLKKTMKFYDEIIKANENKINEFLQKVDENSREVYRLKGVIYRLLNNACLNIQCTKRAFFTEDQIREILEGVTASRPEKSKETNKDED